MSEQFTAQDLAFLDTVDQTLTLRCCCQYNGHGGYCQDEAAVTIKFHIPHICRHPNLVNTKRVDENGCVTQFLCVRCYWEVRQFSEAKIAQTIAMCQQLSGICCHCGFVLRSIMFGEQHMIDVCPRCHTPRIEFHPVCGTGVRDDDGRTFGCGAPLQHYTDVIRSEEWMVPQQVRREQ